MGLFTFYAHLFESRVSRLQVDPHAHALYDAVLVYGFALNQSLAEGVNVSDSREIAKRLFGQTFTDSKSSRTRSVVNVSVSYLVYIHNTVELEQSIYSIISSHFLKA